MKRILLLMFLATALPAQQISYFNEGFLRQGSAALDRAYLGITNGSGSGTVTTVSSGSLSPLFTATVLNPTTTPAISFSAISQNQNLFYASPNGASGAPSFRAIVAADLPGGGSGTVTTFSAGNFSPLFTTSVANPTTTPALSFSAVSQNQNLIFASPDGASGNPSFRALVSGDLPAGTGTVTSFSAGNANPLFTTSVATATTTPALTFTLSYTPVGNVTNASWPNSSDITLISTTNYPTVALKSISAGANVTLTDQGTNVVVASSGGGGGATPTVAYAMVDETNYPMTLRWMQPDVVDGSATFGYEGYGDAFSFGGTGGVHARQNVTAASGGTFGPWSELWATTINTSSFSASATTNAIQPYHNGGFYFQMFIEVRNTNNVRICAGFSSSIGVLTSDTVLTNCAYFRYCTASNDSTWHGVVSDATNQTFVDTGVSLATNTDYLLQMYKTNGTTNVVFVVNRSSPVTTSSNAPDRWVRLTDGMEAFLGQTPLESADKTNWFRYEGYTMDWKTK